MVTQHKYIWMNIILVATHLSTSFATFDQIMVFISKLDATKHTVYTIHLMITDRRQWSAIWKISAHFDIDIDNYFNWFLLLNISSILFKMCQTNDITVIENGALHEKKWRKTIWGVKQFEKIVFFIVILVNIFH